MARACPRSRILQESTDSAGNRGNGKAAMLDPGCRWEDHPNARRGTLAVDTHGMTDPKTTPSKEQIAELEPFHGLELEQIYVVTNERQAGLAVEELLAAAEVGFDTESKPTFHK